VSSVNEDVLPIGRSVERQSAWPVRLRESSDNRLWGDPPTQLEMRTHRVREMIVEATLDLTTGANHEGAVSL